MDDMGDNGKASGTTAAALYVFLIFLYDVLLQFLLVVCALDSICFSTVLVDHMIRLICIILVMNCWLFSQIKSYT